MKTTTPRRRKNRMWPWILGGALLIFVLWQLPANFFLEEQKELRQQVRETIVETFPGQAADFSRTIGLFRCGEETAEADPARPTVVLIHGLDDPGKVWRSLAPELTAAGHDVWLMQYPNDQPVVESGQLFFEELKQLRLAGADRISIVAHSMGGLVSRELLTSPDIAYGRAVESGQVPGVDQLIMVATPNQGSHLARFRFFSEMRDQLARLSTGQATWMGSLLDGAGEAKIDLLPGSSFLTELNSRPHPEGVEMLIIAGVTSPWDEEEINHWADTLLQHASEEQRVEVETIRDYMIRMTHGLGDGLVTVDSTRLEGVSHLTVRGTHLTMIRNITAGSTRVPPAVPIIVERLITPRPPDPQ